MNSKKFKKMDKNKKHSRRRRKKITYNIKNISYLIISIIIIIAFIGFIGSIINKIPEDTELIKPEIFDFNPYGYDWNKDLYGYCNATDEYGNMRTYYFTLEQMAALYQSSDGTLNFTDGIYVSVNNTTSDYNIVTNIYKKNGGKIVKSNDFNEFEFAENSRFLGRNKTYFARGFGFSNDEYRDSYF